MAIATSWIIALLAVGATAVNADGNCPDVPVYLRNATQAAAICSAATQTTTFVTSTTVLSYITDLTTQHATSQKTVKLTNVYTMPSVSVVHSTVTSTSMHTQPCRASTTLARFRRSPAKRDVAATTTSKAAATPTMKAASTTSSKQEHTLTGRELATACSCLGRPVPTTTVQSIQTFQVPSTTTVVKGVPSTTTLFYISNYIPVRTATIIGTEVVTSTVCAN